VSGSVGGDPFLHSHHAVHVQVYAIAFNNPYGDKVVTGSFDKTAKLWDAYTGQLYYTLKGVSELRSNWGVMPTR